jgi:hypothetical protein
VKTKGPRIITELECHLKYFPITSPAFYSTCSTFKSVNCSRWWLWTYYVNKSVIHHCINPILQIPSSSHPERIHRPNGMQQAFFCR